MSQTVFGIVLALAAAVAAPGPSVETRANREHAAAGARHVSTLALAPSTPAESQCPYDFQSPMPGGVFCLYNGALRSPAGSTCAGDVGMIWSSYDPAAYHDLSPRVAPIRSVTLGLVSDPGVVFRAAAASGQPEAADVTAFSSGERFWQAVAGLARLTLEPQLATGPREVLSLDLRGQALPLYEGCQWK